MTFHLDSHATTDIKQDKTKVFSVKLHLDLKFLSNQIKVKFYFSLGQMLHGQMSEWNLSPDLDFVS